MEISNSVCDFNLGEVSAIELWKLFGSLISNLFESEVISMTASALRDKPYAKFRRRELKVVSIICLLGFALSCKAASQAWE